MRSANGVFFSFIFNVESHWNADQTNFVSHMAIIMNLPLAKITDLCGIFISSLFETFHRFNHRKYKRQHVSKHNCFFIFGFIYLDVCVCVKLWTLACIHMYRPTLVFLSGFCVWFHKNSKVSKFISAFSQQKNKIQQELFPSAIFGFQRHCPSKYDPFSPLADCYIKPDPMHGF